jgi:hypothetical protein
MTFFNPFRRREAEPSKPEHVHSWKPIAVNQGEMAGFVTSDGQPLRVTEVLRLCECSEYSQAIVHGHWTLEQVSAGELSKDVVELKRMASL